MTTYDWEEILSHMKSFARVENITDIILLGDSTGKGVGIRRIRIEEDETT